MTRDKTLYLYKWGCRVEYVNDGFIAKQSEIIFNGLVISRTYLLSVRSGCVIIQLIFLYISSLLIKGCEG